jgi:hypothetical protein
MAVPHRATNLSTIRPAEFLQRYRVFLRRARDASHQAFFFLGLLEEPLGSKAKAAVAEYRRFALFQIRTLVRDVHLPEEVERLESDLAAGALTALDATQSEIERTFRLYHHWQAVCAHFRKRLESVDVPALRRDFEAFLVASQAEGFLERLEAHWLPDLLNYLRKNLSLLWVAFLILTVALKVEAIHSLLLNEGWMLLFPLALLALPLAAGRLLPRLLRSRYGAPPAWDLAGPAFRSLRRQAVEPARLIQRWPPTNRSLCIEIFKAQIRKLLLYAGWWLVAFACIYDFSALGKVGGSTVTVFLVLSHFYALLILARVLDYWEFLDPRPVRFLLLLGAMVLLVTLFSGIGREVVIAVLLGAAVLYPLVSRRHRGLLRFVLPLCLIALAGASFLGKKTLDREVWREEDGAQWQRLGRAEWPWPAQPGSRAPVVLMAASGGGSRAAVYTGLALQRLHKERPAIAEQLQAISSVSGGSLASAAYLVRLLETAVDDDPVVRRSERNQGLGDLDEAVERDFLLPTLFGALAPGRTRGSAIEREWQSEVGLHQHRLSDLARHWRWARQVGSPVPPFPIPLFNSSTLDGHDVVISPLAKELYIRPGLDDQASDPRSNLYQMAGEGDDPHTWVYYRDGVYGLEDLLARFDPKLSSSVRASANFPFGFPLVRVKTTRSLFFSPLRSDRQEGKEKVVRLTDGGTLSNSGMWSLFNLLMHRDNLPRLKERGVLLLVIEASRMPSYRQLDQAVNSLWGTIEDQGPVGQRLHREMLELLERTYGNRIAVVQLDLVPRESFNVFTTWALDRGSLSRLEQSFEERWRAELANLDTSWTQLTGSPTATPYIEKRRPPLD